MTPLGVAQVALAAHLEISLQRINEIFRGRLAATPETAWRLAQAFGTTPEFRVNLQANFDLARSRPKLAVRRLRKAS